jgi:hypothetical protein
MFRYILLSTWFIAHAASGLSPQIEVSGRAYSDSACRYYTSSSADFRIEYSGFDGLHPKVLYAYGGEKLGRTVTGLSSGDTAMKLRTDGTTVGEITSRVDERGNYYFKTLSFRVQWEDKDGLTQKTDTLIVNVPSRECLPGEFVDLEIR